LLQRATVLGLHGFQYFGRYYGMRATNNVQEAKANAKKGVCSPVTHVPGVFVWDTGLYAVSFMFDCSADRSLNGICKKKLGRSKIDVDYSFIASMMTTHHGRSLLARYCTQDVVLVALLDRKISALRFIRAMGNLCAIPGQLVLDRASIFRITGLWMHNEQRYHSRLLHIREEQQQQRQLQHQQQQQQQRGHMMMMQHGGGHRLSVKETLRILAIHLIPESVRSKLDIMHIKLDENKGKVSYLVPTKSMLDGGISISEDYEGGKVLHPITGYYLRHLMTLDFASLYPSIIRGANLCYTTFVAPKRQKQVCAVFGLDIKKDLWHEPVFKLRDDLFTTTPYIDMDHNPSYVRKHVLEGLTCYLEQYLMTSRAMKREEMDVLYKKAAGEENMIRKTGYLFLAGELNIQQMADKIMCNSIYGSYGTEKSNFSLKYVAMTITNLARQALEFTRFHIFRTYRKEYGKPFNVTIVYGDTDSVMVLVMDIDENKVVDNVEMPKDDFEQKIKEFIFDSFYGIRDDCNSYFQDPMSLTVEKIARAAIFHTAKCYGLDMAEGPKKPYFIKASGVTSVRRSGCLLTKEMCKQNMDFIIKHKNPAAAVRNVRETLDRIDKMEVPYEKLLLRSTLSKEPSEYEMATPPPHVAVAKIMEAAGENEVHAGDSVKYFIVSGLSTDKVGVKAARPQDVAEKGLSYDKPYYIEAVVNEAKKNLRTVVDDRPFNVKFLFSETIRILAYLEKGKGVIKKMKDKLKREQNKLVEQVVLHGLEIDFDSRKRPSFYDLPAIYRERLEAPEFNWCGYTQGEDIPDISTYVEPDLDLNFVEKAWTMYDRSSTSVDSLPILVGTNSSVRRRKKTQQRQEQEETAVSNEGDTVMTPSSDGWGGSTFFDGRGGKSKRNSEKDEEEENETTHSLHLENDLEYNDLFDYPETEKQQPKKQLTIPLVPRHRHQNSSSSDEMAKTKEIAAESSPVVQKEKPKNAFDMMKRTRNESRTVVQIERNVKRARLDDKSKLGKFLVKLFPCAICNTNTVNTDQKGICTRCMAKYPINIIEETRQAIRDTAITDLEDIINKNTEAHSVCEKCIVDSVGEFQEELLQKCIVFSCPNYYTIRHQSQELNRHIDRMRKMGFDECDI
jgi:DNA polymerase elongation subunit (family B)